MARGHRPDGFCLGAKDFERFTRHPCDLAKRHEPDLQLGARQQYRTAAILLGCGDKYPGPAWDNFIFGHRSQRTWTFFLQGFNASVISPSHASKDEIEHQKHWITK